MNLIVLAIPVFFLLIGIELLWTWREEKRFYRLNDSVADLSCGILEQVAGVFLKTALFAGYLFAFDRYRMWTLPQGSALAWVACWLGVDFCYYWFHRWSHEVNAGWAAHIVHHQSEEYNLTVALRQSVLQGALSWVFYLPLAVLGFPPAMFLTVAGLNTLYQFWIHTRTIGKLGPLEWVLNTPSHHRVHHGRNPKYIDRNHAGSLIVWDRMFGTFQPEEEEPVYGITTPLANWNPVWANLHYWAELLHLARHAARPVDRLRIFWKPPGWRPVDLGGFQPAPEVEAARYLKYDPSLKGRTRAYVLTQFVVVNLMTLAFLKSEATLPTAARVAAAAVIVASAAALGALLDRRNWARAVETVRLLGLAAAGFWLLPVLLAVALTVFAVASLAWLSWLRESAGATGPSPV
ncbi:MAG TPA: sterol desaturase family protein [Vicinamibacteria bacterium]|nr:sterol desaturase family protein [Vicinamibacteria bacterium]